MGRRGPAERPVPSEVDDRPRRLAPTVSVGVTSPVEQIQIECPGCGRVYDDWFRRSVNLGIEGWDEDDPSVQAYLRECSTATCPNCGLVVELDTLVVSGDVWRRAG